MRVEPDGGKCGERGGRVPEGGDMVRLRSPQLNPHAGNGRLFGRLQFRDKKRGDDLSHRRNNAVFELFPEMLNPSRSFDFFVSRDSGRVSTFAGIALVV